MSASFPKDIVAGHTVKFNVPGNLVSDEYNVRQLEFVRLTDEIVVGIEGFLQGHPAIYVS